MLSYCVKQRKVTDCIPGSEQYVKTKNGRNAMKCQCIECKVTDCIPGSESICNHLKFKNLKEKILLNIEENMTIIGFTIKIGIVMFVIMVKIID